MLDVPEEMPLSSGTVNFMIFAMALTVATTCIENYSETGVAVEWKTFNWLVLKNFDITIGFWLIMHVWSYSIFFVTTNTIRKNISMALGAAIYALLQLFLFTTITGFLYNVELSALMRAATCMQICVHAMKAHSYWATNFTYLDALGFEKNPDMSDEDLKNFPDNMNIGTFTYFLHAPTLTYEPSYPRTERINWRSAFGYTAMFLLTNFSIYVILINYVLTRGKSAKWNTRVASPTDCAFLSSCPYPPCHFGC